MDTEETMEDLVTTVEETRRKIKEAFSKTLSNFMITRDSTT